MDIFGFIVAFFVIFIVFKCLGLIFKTSLFLISLPFQIVFGLIGAILAVLLIPAILAGLIGILLSPFVFFPLIVLGLIIAGVMKVVKG